MNENRYNSEPIRRYRRKKRPNAFRTGLLLAMSIILVVGVVIYIMSLTGTGLFSEKHGNNPLPDESTEGTEPLATESETAESRPPETEDPGDVVYVYLDKTPDDIRVGDLVLIDAAHPYSFPATALTLLSEGKTDEYQIANTTLSLRDDVITVLNTMMHDFVSKTGFRHGLISSAYRSYELQKKLHDTNGDSAAAPGCSDYHTGTTFYLDGKDRESGQLIRMTDREETMWLKENAHKYGFIFRFPGNKVAFTGYFLPWQFRFVGIPHAFYMYENDLCLEEYLDFLAQNYNYAGRHLMIEASDGITYEVFYVQGAEEGVIKLPVPENRAYTVSGDNKSGFIVAVALKKTEA